MNIQDLAIAVNESERTGYKPVGERAYTPIGEKPYETHVEALFGKSDDLAETESGSEKDDDIRSILFFVGGRS